MCRPQAMHRNPLWINREETTLRTFAIVGPCPRCEVQDGESSPSIEDQGSAAVARQRSHRHMLSIVFRRTSSRKLGQDIVLSLPPSDPGAAGTTTHHQSPALSSVHGRLSGKLHDQQIKGRTFMWLLCFQYLNQRRMYLLKTLPLSYPSTRLWVLGLRPPILLPHPYV